ncbi:hypothetical protein MTP99_013771 [Tenebrio molitor]|nr:hypothetical protein MTP99_013771 [Tenebrio molitor]
MNAFEGILDDLNKTDFDFLENSWKGIEDFNKNVAKYLKRVNESIQEYQKTGRYDISNFPTWNDYENGDQRQQGTPNERHSSKENIRPDETKEEPPSLRTRTRRNAFKEASQNISVQSSLSLSTKLRRPGSVQDTFQNVRVKMEEVSLDKEERTTLNNVKIKTEVEEMPAPTRPAPRRKKRTQVKQEKIEEKRIENNDRESDVVVQDVAPPIINLVDSDEDDKKQEQARSTRTKSRKTKKTKRARNVSSDDEVRGSDEKRAKSNPEEVNETNYEDAVSVLEQNKETNNTTRILKSQVGENLEATQNGNANATIIVKSPINVNLESTCNMNATVVVENPKYVKNIVPVTAEDLMTDDESEEEPVTKKNPPKPVRTISKPPKQIFSPFEHSPVKKKVEAFEKLQEEANVIPARITRTKTKAKQQQEQENNEATDNAVKSAVKEKMKVFTPTSKFVPTFASTMVKSSRTNPSNVSNESLLSGKSASALKASQAEYREREKKRLEKEQEARKKRDALILAQMEEKKRKREEKQLKAQQQREALEKEKLKALEEQKLKDKRHQQWMAEQEERKQKQKQELEKKRLLAKKRAIEEKKKEEEKRLEEQRKVDEMTATLAKQDEEISRMLQKQKQKSQAPIYLRKQAPLLPTDDCYDSDAEEYRDGGVEPQWAREKNLKLLQKCQLAAGEAVKNTFFSMQAQTPDLQDIFEVIEPHKLKRSSSAVWHKPPRYTMMPTLEDHDEMDESRDE